MIHVKRLLLVDEYFAWVCAEFTPFLGEGLILIVTVNGRRLISLMTNAVGVKQGVESNLAFLQARSIVHGH